MLIRGDKLTDRLKKEVLGAYIYRWTSDNKRRVSIWATIKAGAPTIPLVTDAEWLADHAFHVTAAGNLDGRRRHAEPAWMIETEGVKS